MLGKITKTNVERLAKGELLWDAGHREVVKGFGARRQRGDVFYLLRYRLGGKQHFKTIGPHGSPWTPDTARAKAKEWLGSVAAGNDPKPKVEAPAHQAIFGAEVKRYLERKAEAMKPRAYREVQRHLLDHAEPLHRLALAEIDRRAIALRLSEIETASGPVARNRVRSSLSGFFAWTVREGLTEVNPVAGTGKADEGGSRERVLADAELAEVWAALGPDQFGDIVRLLILTGQRREEIGGLRWSELHSDRIALPPARTKNKRKHIVPLSPAAKAVLERQPRRKNNDGSHRELVFGVGEGGFSGWSDAKAALDDRILAARRKADSKAKPMPQWRIHDLRRTAATIMADKLGVLPHIIEAILNHVSGHKAGVAGICNRARYADEVRDALTRWAEHVHGLLHER